MHYYKRNIGDYAKKTGRLSMLQHGAYTLLIDSCYDREEFPTLEQALDWTWASTEAEIDAVKFVLNRFFQLDKEGKYVQNRILEELLQYHKNADTNKRIAINRETKRKENSTKRAQVVNEAPPNHKPLTTNHKPSTNNQLKIQAPEGVTQETWESFLTQRKLSRAAVTETVIKSIQKEADKIEWTLEQALTEIVARGWRGFKAEWVIEKQKEQPKSFYQQDLEAKKAFFDELSGVTKNGKTTIDMNFLEIKE
jgi:uncharacterized protein YdaU (DUF1376 family)